MLDVTKVDSVQGSTPGYGTFGSWNNHVGSDSSGNIFIAYSYLDDNHHQPDYWRLAGSQDGGSTFKILYDGAADGSLAAAPALEIDSYGNVYVIASTDAYGDAELAPMMLYRFAAGGDYADPEVYSLPIGTPGKFSTVFDGPRNLVHVLQWGWWKPQAAHPNFYSITPRGLVTRSTEIFRNDEAHPHAAPQYPCLGLTEDGSIVAAWATLDNALWKNGAGIQNYYDAHFIVSPDGGKTWQGPGGSLVLPIVGDDTGPAFTINDPTNPADTEIWGTPDYHGNWNIVHNVAFHKGALHFFYGGVTPTPHVPYVRFSWPGGQVTERRSPFFATDDGYRFSDAGGAFVQDDAADQLLFAGRYWHAGQAYLGVASTLDGGDSWRMQHTSPPFPGSVRYINVARRLLADGSIIGSLTADPMGLMTEEGQPGVYFFRSQ